MTTKIELRMSGDDDSVGYLYLPEHPGPGARGAVARQVRLKGLLKYAGAEILLDLDKEERLIGIEIVG